MALLSCAVCEKQVSEKAVCCPHCGDPEFLTEKKCSDCHHIVNRDLGICPECGNPDVWKKTESSTIQPIPNKNIEDTSNQNEKSMVVGLLLTFFFGPLGLLYTNIKAGLIMTVVTIILIIPSLGASLMIGWIAAPLIVWTKSPLENAFAKTCVDVCSKKQRATPWSWWHEDSYEYDNSAIRLAAVQSVLNSGWRLGGVEAGEHAWESLEVYTGQDTISWENLLDHVSYFGPRHELLERSSPVQLSEIVRSGMYGPIGSDWLIDSCVYFRFRDKYFDEGGYSGYNRGERLQRQELRLSLLNQKSLSFEGFRLFGEATGKAEPTHIQPDFFELMQHTGWVMPCENICFISERPNQIKLDEAGRLHCENGPAIVYPDGFSVHAWHGTIFPEEWVHNKPSASDALYKHNVELRRVACEMVGWENILNELDAVTIDKDSDPEIGELVDVAIRGESQKFLRVTCGTGRNFALPVPLEMTTALEANAWTWGLEPNQYKPEIRS